MIVKYGPKRENTTFCIEISNSTIWTQLMLFFDLSTSEAF